MTSRPRLFERHVANPILTAADWPYSVNTVFNPGAAVGPDGETVLLVRVEDRTGVSHFGLARSQDGYTRWKIEPEPVMVPDREGTEEVWGLEDPRITQIGDRYLIAYTAFSSGGPLVALAETEDFRTFRRRGAVMVPEDKDAALFPDTFDGRWALIHRPVISPATRVLGHIWLSYSPDLHHWGDHCIVIPARSGSYWDAEKVGIGPPPLETPEGWLVLFHGVKVTAAGGVYRVGTALLDRDDPRRLLARSDEWVFGPWTDYERSGDVPDVVFPTGWILEDDGDTLRVYYGAADTCVAVATASLSTLLEHLARHCACGTRHSFADGCPDSMEPSETPSQEATSA